MQNNWFYNNDDDYEQFDDYDDSDYYYDRKSNRKLEQLRKERLRNEKLSEEQFKQLEELIKAKNIEGLSHLLSQAQDVKIKNKNNETLLHCACKEKEPSIEVIKCLIKHGIDLNLQDSSSGVALNYLCNKETTDFNIITYLLEQHAKPVTNWDKKYFNWELIKLLISYGGDVNKTTYNRETFLHHICENENFMLEDIKFLVEKGADVNKSAEGYYCRSFEEHKEGETPLYLLCMRENPPLEAVEYLLKHKSNPNALIEKKYKEEKTILHELCKSKKPNIKLIELLLNCHANIDIEDANGKTPIEYAFINENAGVELIKLFLEKGVNINKWFFLICARKNFDITLFNFIKEISQINATDEDGKTFLHYEYKNKELREKMVEFFIMKSGNINTQDKMRQTPLHMLFHDPEPSFEAVKLLVEHKADLNAKTDRNETALHIACRNKGITKDILNYLLKNRSGLFEKNNQNQTNSMDIAFVYENYVAMEAFFHFCSFEMKKFVESSLIKRFAQGSVHTNDPQLLKFLLEQGMNPNAASKNGSRTFLHMLCASSSKYSLELINLLLLHNADPYKRDNKGKTPFELIPSYSHNLNKLMNVLIEHKIDLSTVKIGGDSLLISACKENNYGLVLYLLLYGFAPDSAIMYYNQFPLKNENSKKYLTLLELWKEDPQAFRNELKPVDLDDMAPCFPKKIKNNWLTFFMCVKEKNTVKNNFPMPKPIVKKILLMCAEKEIEDNRKTFHYK